MSQVTQVVQFLYRAMPSLMCPVCRQFLVEEGVDATDWPLYCPEVNPIEDLCIDESSGVCPDVVRSANRHAGAMHTSDSHTCYHDEASA